VRPGGCKAVRQYFSVKGKVVVGLSLALWRHVLWFFQGGIVV
jgi:hypothetical protein